jgi:hypothetical protein
MTASSGGAGGRCRINGVVIAGQTYSSVLTTSTSTVTQGSTVRTTSDRFAWFGVGFIRAPRCFSAAWGWEVVPGKASSELHEAGVRGPGPRPLAPCQCLAYFHTVCGVQPIVLSWLLVTPGSPTYQPLLLHCLYAIVLRGCALTGAACGPALHRVRAVLSPASEPCVSAGVSSGLPAGGRSLPSPRLPPAPCRSHDRRKVGYVTDPLFPPPSPSLSPPSLPIAHCQCLSPSCLRILYRVCVVLWGL